MSLSRLEPTPLRMLRAGAVGACLLALLHAGSRLAAQERDAASRGLRGLVVVERGPAYRHGRVSPFAAVSPDARLVLTLGDDLKLHLWDTSNGLERFSVPTVGKRPVHSAAFSPGGRYLVTVGPANTIALWDVRTGREAFRLDGEEAGTLSATISPDDRALAAVGRGGTVTVWSLPAGGKRFTIGRTGAARPSVAFSQDGALVIVAEPEGTIQIWVTRTGARGARIGPP